MDLMLVFTRFRPPNFRGGIERYVDLIARRFRERGLGVHVVAFKENVDFDTDVPHTFVSTPHMPFLATLVFAWRSRRIWSRAGVVSVQYPHLGLGVPAAKLAVTVHTTAMGEARSLRRTGKGFRARVRSISRRTIGVWLEKKVFRRARRIIAINEHIADEIEQYYGIRRERIAVIGNGVDCEFFTPDPAYETMDGSRPLRVLYVGRLTPRKNVETLIQTLQNARSSTRLRIVGAGADMDRLRRLAYEGGAGERIAFRGYRRGLDLRAEYRWADVFAMPSVYEGMPLTVLEAKGCGVPTISAPFRGAHAMIPDATGIVLKTGAPEEFAEAFAHLQTEPAVLAAMRKASRKDAVERYSWDSVVEELSEALGLESSGSGTANGHHSARAQSVKRSAPGEGEATERRVGR